MKRILIPAAMAAAAIFFGGCETIPPGAERGPNGTMAYDVLIEASEPGARIEANGAPIGNTPIHLKIFGDPDGTFHDFGSEYYIIRALPLVTNQFPQIRAFGTGRFFGPEDRIPQRVYFDMNQPAPNPPPASYGYPPEYYYGPRYYYYGPAPYYGPQFRFNIGPYHPHHRGW
jgi:hypothetical protein